MAERKILKRTVEPGQVILEKFAAAQIGPDPVVWLKGKIEEGMVLLAHADDGVIWGKARNGDFDLPQIQGFTQAALRPVTLHMARLFNENSEIFLWRVGEGAWQARRLADTTAGEDTDTTIQHYFEEAQVLWGTGIIGFNGEFSQAADGEEEFHHAPPVGVDKVRWGEQRRGKGDRKLRLHVRHYLESDEETGWLRIGMSRLVGLGMEGEK